MKRTFTFILLFGCLAANAQETMQQMRGRVMKSEGDPVAAAAIFLLGTSSYSSVTDSQGVYSFEAPAGNYSLIVQAAGYKTVTMNKIVLLSGKQQVQDIFLEDIFADLETVTISGNRQTGSVGLDLWNIQQFAAVFYDPARVVNSHAGAINTDDGTNQMTVRGTSPDYVQWKLEGVEIVNPNHLENGGTVNDRPSFNGGGVSMISAQLLQNSQFHFAPFDATQGNALSGIFDMRLRNGNNKKREHTVQVSLLGTDLAIEGPFSKNSDASYLLNFRYSTIGLLSKMGVYFGDEQSTFTDFSYSFTFPIRRNVLRVFGMTGMSETRFSGKTDTSLVEIQKDLQDINYNSVTSINGISFLSSWSSSVYFKSVAAYSVKNVLRTAGPAPLHYMPAPDERDALKQEKISTVHYIARTFGPALQLKAGSYINIFKSAVTSEFEQEVLMDGRTNDLVLQPFIAAEGKFGQRFRFQAGLHSLWLTAQEDFLLQPRILLGYRIGERNDLVLRAGTGAQLASPFLYVNSGSQLRPTVSDNISFIHVFSTSSLKISSEIYLQRFERVPENKPQGFSGFNYFNELVFIPLDQGGKALSYGYELLVEKRVGQFYMVASGTVYNSEVLSAAGGGQTARFNSGYNTFLTGGREFRLKNKNNYLSTDLRFTYRDGFMDRSSDPNEIYIYDERLPEYWRTDVRVSYKKNKEKSTVIWALDLQNITNRKNVAYRYYDRVTGQRETKFQLGLIPVLSYKILF